MAQSEGSFSRSRGPGAPRTSWRTPRPPLSAARNLPRRRNPTSRPLIRVPRTATQLRSWNRPKNMRRPVTSSATTTFYILRGKRKICLHTLQFASGATNSTARSTPSSHTATIASTPSNANGTRKPSSRTACCVSAKPTKPAATSSSPRMSRSPTCAAQKTWNSNLSPSAICEKRYGKNTDTPSPLASSPKLP
jgi:hypothetical protein